MPSIFEITLYRFHELLEAANDNARDLTIVTKTTGRSTERGCQARSQVFASQAPGDVACQVPGLRLNIPCMMSSIFTTPRGAPLRLSTVAAWSGTANS